MKLTKEEQEKLKKQEERRKNQAEALLRKQEEERKAAEAAAAPAKGGKKSAGKPTRTGSKADKEREEKEAAEAAAAAAALAEASADDEELIQYNSTDDNPARKKDFIEFQKVMSEMDTGSATVGSIMGAMIYQISQNSEHREKEGLDDKYYERKGVTKRKTLTMAEKRASSHKLLVEQLENREIDNLFENMMNSLNIEHGVVETDYKHQFNADTVLNDPN